MRILIAEDDSASRKFIFGLLSQYGHCDLVIDGLEALDAFLMALKDEKPYDLICLDIMMPKVNGVRVLKGMRDLERKRGLDIENKSKVIMTTVFAETGLVDKAFEYGCNAYVSKPIDAKQFVDVVHSTIVNT